MVHAHAVGDEQARSMNTSHAVKVRNLTKHYKSKAAVSGLNFDIIEGENFGILGTNGAGKTTTVEMIAGLRTPSEGVIKVAGLDPFTERRKLRQILGVQLQHAALHGALKVRELVELYRSFYPDPLDAATALDLVELNEKAGTKFDDLSGGQMQRLSIALALVGRPHIVVLDELTTGLDPRARRRIWQSIESLEEQTVVLVSHAMDEVERLCHRVALMDAGAIIAEGTPQQLKDQAGAATLEETFVALTGKALESEEEDA